MKNKIASILSLLLALALSSCVDDETAIHLKKDGSGTIVQNTRLGKSTLAMPPEQLREMVVAAEETAKQRAAMLGEGVAFAKFEKVSEGNSKGWRSTYQFKDINKLQITNFTKMQISTEPKEPNPEDLIAFQYNDGVLKIRPNMADGEVDKPLAGCTKEELKEQIAQMKAMYGDLKLGIKLIVDSGIAETNASHAQGNTISLFELDMGKLILEQEKLLKLDDQAFQAAVKALQAAGKAHKCDGMKRETKPEVTVKLK